MRYLFMTEYFPESENVELTGGVESRSLHIAKELAKKHDVTVLCSRQPGQKNSTVFGVKVIRCGPNLPYSNKGHILGRLSLACDMFLRGRKMKADVVEGSSFIAYLPAYFVGKKLRAEKIATWHETWVGEWIKNKGITGFFGEIWERLSLMLTWDKIISVSEFTKKRLRSKSEIVVINNGIETKKFHDIKAKKHKDLTICYFGRINWPKRLDVLIKAIKGLDIKCKIMGEGPALSSLKKLAKDLDVDVEFTGRIMNHGDLLMEAKRCHIYVSPSTLEGFGITILEAMALGLPFVISDIAPFKEVTRGKGGLLFRKNDSADLRRKLVKLIKERPFSKRQAQARELLRRYSWSRLAKRYEKI